MKKSVVIAALVAGTFMIPFSVSAQYKTKDASEKDSQTQELLAQAESSETPVVITLEQALEIALSENVSVKVADMEIERTGYAKKGTYAALFPQIDASAAYQRTIKKQVMYMDFDMSSLGGLLGGGAGEGGEGGKLPDGTELPDGVEIPDTGAGTEDSGSSNGGGMEVGRWNTYTAGVTAAMPLVNAQLWQSLKLSGLDVELAVEKARSSRLETVTQVKNAYFATLMAKEAFNVYKEVYENAMSNYEETKKKFDAEKVSELELLRAKTTVANAVPNVYNAESSIVLALWQLKAILGVDLDMNLDIAGKLEDFADQMPYDIHQHDSVSLDYNTTMKQLAIQSEMLAQTIKLQKYAAIPSLALAFNFSLNAMTNDFDFSSYRWTPHSYVGLSLNIPIFAGGKRYQQIRQAKNQHQSLTTMETNMKSYYSAQDAVAMAAKGYSIAEKAYQVGRSTLIELNDAQLALTQARLAEYQAIYNFVVAKAQLEQTLGQDFIE